MAFAELPFFVVNHRKEAHMCQDCGHTDSYTVNGYDKCSNCHIQSYDHLQRVRQYHNEERLSDLYDRSKMGEEFKYLEMKYHLD